MQKQKLLTGQSENDDEITTDTARSESAANFTIEIEDENVSVSTTPSLQVCKKQLEESKNKESDEEEEKKAVVDNYVEEVQNIVRKH